MGSVAAVHAAMTKRDVPSAIGWVGVIILSPILGALIYMVAGVNRIRRKSLLLRRHVPHSAVETILASHIVDDETYAQRFGARMASLKRLGDRVASSPLVDGNQIDLLGSGDETYDAFCTAIDAADRSIILETYIFDRDRVGKRIADRLIAARQRGVEVRVLIDAVGARYSVPSILPYLEAGGVTVASFNGQVIMGLRLPYANLRTHRKIMVVDGLIAFAGGMNIRAGFSGVAANRDTHFRVHGPLVADLFAVAAEDWHFETGETLSGEPWISSGIGVAGPQAACARAVVSGPDSTIETNHKLLTGAFSIAEKSIRIMSPYFLPDNVFLGALATAARRGVAVEIVVPSQNNLAIVARAMMAQFAMVLKDGSRVFLSSGPFDHSKLLVVDGNWAFVGSSNLDSRSLRLNFEIDLEVHDPNFARKVEARILAARDGGTELKLDQLKARPFPLRLTDRIFWLGSPYL
ncbi:cardiolipin synthase [Ciceribacter sp. L1K23]|uniref:cardiolipin synthase n=1 Tax=Ciceribacter sp. L1K23 TaxID=2820276 RepID=UPI001B81111F|nr:cardiolipin synthase [Ciceribacter sp. L1K23]MBR0555097.1 cardiolipin synthase [Ciceribacter sp. L1K23]